MTVPGAVDVISHLATIGASWAPALFLISRRPASVSARGRVSLLLPIQSRLVEFAAKENVAVLPGALTPTEIVTAWEAGAEFVKVFPWRRSAGTVTSRRSKLRFPIFPDRRRRRQPADGRQPIVSGATAIGVGTELIPPEAISRRQPERIRELALRFTEFVKEARERVEKFKRSAIVQPYEGDEKCEV